LPRKCHDLIKVELYGILTGGSVVAVVHLRNALIAASDESEFLRRMDASKSILLRELAHGVANNFAIVAALLRTKSAAVSDADARTVLNEAIEQIVVMGRVHRRLRAEDRKAMLDSAVFLHDLCYDLKAIVLGRPLAIECRTDSHQLCMDQAVVLGLIVNELVTNAVKHAFPCGRAGRVRIGFEALRDELRLTVEDDGVGFGPPSATETQGQDLIGGLLQQVDGRLEVKSSSRGSSFRISIPCRTGIQSPQSLGVVMH
jgi:two-component sensor histidine kinase